LTLYVVFLFLAIYNAGCMTTLQLQHYGIYPAVGKENFAAYMRANNRAAMVPTILPALSLLIVSVLLMVYRPGFIRTYEAAAGRGRFGAFRTRSHRHSRNWTRFHNLRRQRNWGSFWRLSSRSHSKLYLAVPAGRHSSLGQTANNADHASQPRRSVRQE
jgi:hypothetical protein